MDVDDEFPSLSAIARSRGKTLKSIGAGARPTDTNYLRLGDCCQLVTNDMGLPVEFFYGYLATVDELLKRLSGDAAACQRVWEKLTGGSPSSFLDTATEAAWAIHFWNQGLSPQIERPFDPSDPTSKDADIFIVLDGEDFWLDVFSVNLTGGKPWQPTPSISFPWRPGVPELANLLSSRAIEKYNSKFHGAVTRGPLIGASVGILLCLLKAEPLVVPQFTGWLGNGVDIDPPANLFRQDCPGLKLVWVHTLRPADGSKVLEPVLNLKWIRGSK